MLGGDTAVSAGLLVATVFLGDVTVVRVRATAARVATADRVAMVVRDVTVDRVAMVVRVILAATVDRVATAARDATVAKAAMAAGAATHVAMAVLLDDAHLAGGHVMLQSALARAVASDAVVVTGPVAMAAGATEAVVATVVVIQRPALAATVVPLLQRHRHVWLPRPWLDLRRTKRLRKRNLRCRCLRMPR